MYNPKVGDMIFLNKIVGLSYGDFKGLRLDISYEIIDVKKAYGRPGFDVRLKVHGGPGGWWVHSVRDVRGLERDQGQLQFSFMDEKNDSKR